MAATYSYDRGVPQTKVGHAELRPGARFRRTVARATPATSLHGGVPRRSSAHDVAVLGRRIRWGRLAAGSSHPHRCRLRHRVMDLVRIVSDRRSIDWTARVIA